MIRLQKQGVFALLLLLIAGQVAAPSVGAQAPVATLTLNPGESDLCSAVIDPSNGFAYFVAATGALAKIRLSDFTEVNSLYLPGSIGGGGSFVSLIDTSGFMYLVSSTGVPSIVTKLRLSDLAEMGALSLNLNQTASQLGAAAVIDPVNTFAYFATATTIVKVDLASFQVTKTLALNQDELIQGPSVIDVANGYAYFMLASTNLQPTTTRVLKGETLRPY